MEKRTQVILLINLVLLACLILTCSIWNGIKSKEIYDDHDYISNEEDNATDATLLSVVSFYLIYNNIIPLDLAVMLEFNAIFYTGFIVADANMTYVNKPMGRLDSAKSNTLNLLDNLAEVEYIMSDKTGTLT